MFLFPEIILGIGRYYIFFEMYVLRVHISRYEGIFCNEKYPNTFYCLFIVCANYWWSCLTRTDQRTWRSLDTKSLDPRCSLGHLWLAPAWYSWPSLEWEPRCTYSALKKQRAFRSVLRYHPQLFLLGWQMINPRLTLREDGDRSANSGA